MSNLIGKSAVVTGSTRGIGMAIARAMLEHGAKVLISGRKESDVKEAVRILETDHGDRVKGKACDVRIYDQVRELMVEARRMFGGLDMLINNAGVGAWGVVEEMAVDEWLAVLETNLSGVFYCCREAIPLLKEKEGGYIVNIGSLAGKNAFAGGAAYCASKFGLIGFSEALMQEVRYDRVRVSCVMPGSVNTDFGRGGEQAQSATWKLLPEDVATVVISLLLMDPRALPSRVELRPSEPSK